MSKSPFSQVLRQNNFLKLWTSQVLSQVTTSLINFLIILRVFEYTRSSIAVSLVWFFYSIPSILIGPFSGTIIDLTNKRRILILTNLAQAVIVLLYLGAKTNVWPIYSLIFLYSLINQLYIPAESAILPYLIPKKLYPSANSLFMFTVNIAFLAGYTLAGPVVRFFGKQAPFLLGSIFLGVATLAVARLPKISDSKIKKIRGLEDFFARVKEGYMFIKDNKLVLFPLLMIVLAQIVIALMIVVIPPYAVQTLNADLRDAALILITPAGIGAILGSRAAVLALRKKMRKKKIITNALLLATISFFSLAMVIPYLPMFKILFSSLAALLLGMSFSLMVIPSQTLIQEMTPKILLGRVYSVVSFLITFSALLPVLITATIADLLGVKTILFLISLATFSLFMYVVRKEPFIRLNSDKIISDNQNSPIVH